MKDVEAVTASLSFDDLLGAVNESSRGRWFLDEYQRRLRKAEIGDILTAINRMESRFTGMPTPGVASTEVVRMRAALNQTRADIAKLAPGISLSDEGRLFAGLADMARKALPAEKATAELAPGIIKALQLVDDMDVALNGVAKGEQYFMQDQALFEPAAVAPAPKPVLVSVTPEPVSKPADTIIKMDVPKADVEAPAQGAKLVIVRAGEAATLAKAAVAPEAAAPAPVAPEKKPEISLAVEKVDNPRIVIIRRKPEEMTEVPLADDVKAESAA
jgi:hypothetical protein